MRKGGRFPTAREERRTGMSALRYFFSEHCFLNPYAPLDRHKHRLPHWQQGAVFYFVTWRLADSLSSAKLKAWKYEREVWLRLHPKPWDEKAEDDTTSVFLGK